MPENELKDNKMMRRIGLFVISMVWSVMVFSQRAGVTEANVFKNSELTISRMGKGTWIIENDGATMYILEGEKRSMLIDTGKKCEGLDQIVRQITNKPLDVVLTHSHTDHTGNLHYFDQVYMHPGDSALSLSRPYEGRFIWLADGDTFDLGGRTIDVYHMPGHTPGSIALFDRSTQTAFTGDTFGSSMVWMQLKPQMAMTVYYQSCARMEKLMKELHLTTLQVGHEPHENRLLGLSYIIAMKDLAKRLCDGDFTGAVDYHDKDFEMSCEKPMIVRSGEATIVFNSAMISDKTFR